MANPFFLRSFGLVVMTTFCFVGACLGQERITAEVWERYHRKAGEICRDTPYRMKITVETRKSLDSGWQPYSKAEMEFVGRRSHFRGKYLETIQIDKTMYRKRADGTWKKVVKGKGNSTVRVIERTWEQYTSVNDPGEYTERRVDGNVTILQLESRYKIEYVEKNFVYNHHDLIRVWFDDLGRFVKKESFRHDPHLKNFIHRTEEFEYDPNIYIENPESGIEL